jgi:hypothetical protein
MRAWIVALAALAAVAGCLGVGTEDAPADPDAGPTPNLSTAIEQSHDHDDDGLHGLAWNAERVGYHTGYEDPADAPDEVAGFSEGFRGFAVAEDHAYLCRGGDSSGVTVVNVSDATDPTFASHVPMPQCNDVVVSDDGDWVVAGTQRNPILGAADDSAAGPASPQRGAYVLDVSDPSDPDFESFHEVPYNGVHTLTWNTTEDGRDLVLVQSYDLYSTADPTGEAPLPSPGGAAPATHRTVVTELVERPDGTHELERLSAYSATGATPENPDEQIIVHDAIPATHPETGDRYLIVAYWDQGVHILDFEDPDNPQLVSTFENFAPSEYANVHRADVFPELIDGKWVLVAGPEIATANETGQLTLADITDPGDPSKLGHWTLPGELKITDPYRFSPHNFRLTPDGTVHLGHFHAGVWSLSVDEPGTLQQPQAVAAYEPTAPEGGPPGGPMTWGVEVGHGYVYAMDTPTGLHVLDTDAG